MTTKIRTILCTAVVFASFSVCAAQQTGLATTNVAQSQTTKIAAANYAKMPMTFESNVGQTDSRVNFLSRGSGYVVFLTSGGMVFSARSQFVANTGTPTNIQPASNQPQNATVIQLNLVTTLNI